MFKRLMIGLFALSLAAIWVSEANARDVRRRRSVGVTVFGVQDTEVSLGSTFDTTIYGLPADTGGNCGEVRGELYCAQDSTPAAILACDKATGDSAALVLAADGDLIKPKAPPYSWSHFELNSDLADFGQRRQLRVFAEMALLEAPEIITLPTGKTNNKAGLYAITDETVEYWKDDTHLTDDLALRRFIGTGDPVLTPEDGFGINGEQYLQNLPGGLIPIAGNNLAKLEGHTGCIAVHFDQLKSGDDLHGKYRGLIAVKFRSTTNSSVTMEVLDVDDVCRNLPLYNNIETVAVANTPECLVAEAVVFAPAPYSVTEYVDAFPEVHGTITTCIDGVCKGTVEVVSDGTNGLGQNLCSGDFPYFVDFIPINRGGSGSYANWAFTGYIVYDDSNDALDFYKEVICAEGVADGVEGVELSRYHCVPLDTVLNPAEFPDCHDCGQLPWPYIPE